MKKIIFIAVFAVAGTVSRAQTMFGVQAGVNLASIKNEVSGINIVSEAKPGLILGVLADVPVVSSISFRPELNFIQKGGKNSYTETDGAVTEKREDKIFLNYIQLSPNFVYNIPAGSGKVYLGLGPEFSFAVSGKEKTKKTETGPGFTNIKEETFNVKFDGADNNITTDDYLHLKSFDAGLNILGGYHLANGIFFGAGYTVGFSNLISDANSSFKNRGFHLKLGYMSSKHLVTGN